MITLSIFANRTTTEFDISEDDLINLLIIKGELKPEYAIKRDSRYTEVVWCEKIEELEDKLKESEK